MSIDVYSERERALENEFFFISQLFDKNWEPRHYNFRWGYD